MRCWVSATIGISRMSTSSQPVTIGPDFEAHISDLIDNVEAAMDDRLQNPFDDHSIERWRGSILAFRNSLRDFTQATSYLPEFHPDPADLAFLDRPVVITGLGRSGTSLLRNLLDSHPSLLTFSGETRFWRRASLSASYQEQVSYTVSRIFMLLVSLDGGKGPRWNLSGGKADLQTYLNFVSLYDHYVRLMPQHPNTPVKAATAAFYAARGSRETQPLRWVNKAPDDIRYKDVILKAFPQAKFILSIRDPRARMTSRKMRANRGSNMFDLAHQSDHVRQSWTEVAETLAAEKPETSLLVRYEDLVQQPEAVMRRIADFLEIEFTPSMLEPTVYGDSARMKSGYGEKTITPGKVMTTSLDKWRQSMSENEIQVIDAFLQSVPDTFGYTIPPVSAGQFWRAARKVRQEYQNDPLRTVSHWITLIRYLRLSPVPLRWLSDPLARLRRFYYGPFDLFFRRARGKMRIIRKQLAD
jgi:hypothetical protein